MTANGSNQTRITNDLALDDDPAWSPDGSMRSPSGSDRDSNYEIYVMNSNGTASTRLTNNPEVDMAPAWSPDGERIAFQSSRDGNFEYM